MVGFLRMGEEQHIRRIYRALVKPVLTWISLLIGRHEENRKFTFQHRTNTFATHQPVLWEAVQRTRGAVVEFGCGFGSTPMLHFLCSQQNRELLTLESDPVWLSKFVKRYSTPHHRFLHVEDWDSLLKDPAIVDRKWDVAFVDQAPWEARHKTVVCMKKMCTFIVLHDCDYFPTNGMFGTVIKPIRNMNDTGERDYSDIFRYFKEYFPLPPWPYELTGPPTLIGSDFEPCDFEIDFGKYVTVQRP